MHRLCAAEVAPATLASTFVTSVAGVGTFLVLSTQHHGPIAPDWGVGIALGIGGLIGGYTGARLQPQLPESAIRHVLGLLRSRHRHSVRLARCCLNSGFMPRLHHSFGIVETAHNARPSA